jgi:hypothetical protein
VGAGEATCQFAWGTTPALSEPPVPCEAAVPDGSTSVPVQAKLSQLRPDTTYFYRLQATNKNGTNPGVAGQDQSFTTPGPGVRDESVTDVSSTSVTLGAVIDPHQAPASYYFQYGTADTAGCEASPASSADSPAAPGEAIGSGGEPVEVTPSHIQGLLAGTVYHYRVVVVSEVAPGEFENFGGPDRTFTTQTAAQATLPARHWQDRFRERAARHELRRGTVFPADMRPRIH